MRKIWMLVLLVGLFSCENKDAEQEVESVEKVKEEVVIGEAEEEEVSYHFDDEVAFARMAYKEMSEGRYDLLTRYTSGKILFSPYAYIDTATAREVTIEEIKAGTDEVHFWGIQDGSGDSLLMSTPEYLNQYIFGVDILGAEELSIQTYEGEAPKAYGSELHNVHQLYPEATFVEFYIAPSEEGYLDWKALIFVVEKQGEDYLLKAIIHNQWTT